MPFADLPDHARVWIFAAARPLPADERDAVLADVDAFLDQWAAHGSALTGGRDWRYDRFLFVAVDERAAGVSGCSIDALTRQLRGWEQRLGVDLLDNGPVLYRSEDGIVRVPRAQFGSLAAEGRVGEATTVFDNTVTTVGAVRDGRWETVARDTWHGPAFFTG
ncbi:MAG TPA: hypothetical protein VGA37_12445 [Gemmatimonadales bacterium]